MKNNLINLAIAGVLISTPLYPKTIVKCPETLEIWLKENISYQDDINGYWKTPKETVEDKGGDCEDFGFLVKKILKDLGYRAKVIWIKGKTSDGKNYNHAICVFGKNKKLFYFSNQYLTDWKSFKTFEEIASYNCKNWTWYREISLPKKFGKIHRKK